MGLGRGGRVEEREKMKTTIFFRELKQGDSSGELTIGTW